MTDRRTYRTQVESLLEQIRVQVEELRRLSSLGVRRAGLAERKRELARTRQQLRAVVEGAGAR